MPINRRDFFQQAAATLAATTAAGAVVATAACAPDGSTRAHTGALDAALLAALGETVLPESLGAESRTRAVRAFADWLAGFTPVAEQMHGYGDAEITYTPSDPAPGWQAQLAGLERLATQQRARALPRSPLSSGVRYSACRSEPCAVHTFPRARSTPPTSPLPCFRIGPLAATRRTSPLARTLALATAARSTM